MADETQGCRSCGRPHNPVAATLARLNQRLAGLDQETRRLADDQSSLLAERARLRAEARSLTQSLVDELTAEQRAGGDGAAPPPRAPTAVLEAPAASDPGPLPSAPETSPRSAQNTLLSLGGVLLGIAAIVVTALFYTTTATGGRAFILGVATMLALAVPLLLTRRTLTATAETIAGFGLLLVLLDGYAAYSADLAGMRGVPPLLFSAVLCGLLAGVAAAYRLASHLRAPQFAALLAVQPFLPLVAAHLRIGRDGLALVFAAVAALNLASVEALSRDLSRAIARVRLPGATPGPGGHPWPRRLRELAWVLCGLTLAASVSLSATGLVRAVTVTGALRSAFVLLLATAVGVAAGRLSRRGNLGHLAGGAAAFVIIATVSRVEALALPDYTLVLTAAVAAAVAVGTGLLPESARRGPLLGSLVGAALTAVVVLVTIAGAAAGVLRASVWPQVWAADLDRLAAPVLDWQVPAAAVLLSILAVLGTSVPWRVDAAVGSAVVVTLALPGVAWWVRPIVAALVATVALGTALRSRLARAALLRSTAAGLLGLYALATSLARPEVTAAVCGLLTLVAAAAAVLTAGWPGRFGPYADRVADSAVGAAAFTLPATVGTFAWLGGAPGSVLVPLTLVATAIGLLGAALSRLAAGNRRTASAVGALAAAAGCVVLASRADGAELADLGVAALLLAAATTTATTRVFEVTFPGRRKASTVDTPAESSVDRPQWRFDAAATGAALSTAALIVAMARLAAVAAPGIGLVTTSTMVLLVSLGVMVLPAAWQPGPRVGATVVGGAIVVVTAGVALVEAGRAVAAATPFWAADLAAWPDRVSTFAPYGWQVPLSLLLAAVVAWALLPSPYGGDIAFVTLSLAGLSLPAVFALPWWSASVIAFGLAALAGTGAALVGPADRPGTHRRRLALAAGLGLYAAAASAVAPAGTALVLSGLVAAGVLVATTAQLRRAAPPSVAGVATAAALTAGPGSAATLALAGGSTRTGVLGAALVVAAFGVAVAAALRAARVRWGSYPAFGVGLASLVVAVAAALPDPAEAQVWAAGAALVATAAAAVYRWDAPAAPVSTSDPMVTAGLSPPPARRRLRSIPAGSGLAAILVSTAVPAALLAAVASTPAWLTALVGPYRTLRQVWGGYAVTPEPERAGPAVLTLLLLTGVAAGIAATLGGRRYLLAAVLPPLAATALLVPSAAGAARGLTPWVALAVALATGLGAALTRPTLTSATTLLRGTAGFVCALTGGAGIAGSLAVPSTTLAALGIVLVAALVAAGLGQDPAVRTVAWVVAATAGFALPSTALAAAGAPLRPAAFGVLAMCAVLVGAGWLLGRDPGRRGEGSVVDLCAALGATFALLLSLGSPRHTAAVLTIWGLLLGAAALRRDRPARWRQWLVRSALGAELAACWMLLYAVEVALAEAYTLPFAAVAVLIGAVEQRRRPALSSWLAYGPALIGVFLPSLALVLAGQDPVWRWVAVLAVAVGTVIVGSWRGLQAPAFAGAGVAMLVTVTEMIRLLAAGRIFGALLVALAGLVLIGFGALFETRRRARRPIPPPPADPPPTPPPADPPPTVPPPPGTPRSR